MQYFNTLPKISYDLEGKEEFNLITDIFRFFKVRDGIVDEAVLLDKYEVKDGETPEMVSNRFYSSVYYHWVVMSVNKIKCRYYDWPMSQVQFGKYLKDKYENPGAIHHYEINQLSGPTASLDNSHVIEVNADYPNAYPVSNREYEERLQTKKRLIKILNPDYLEDFVQEYQRIITR